MSHSKDRKQISAVKPVAKRGQLVAVRSLVSLRLRHPV